MKITPNYIGLTGISDNDELLALVRHLEQTEMPAGYLLHAGILLSDWTFHGGIPPAARYPSMPAAYKLLEMIPNNWRPIIHYNTRSSEPLSQQIEAIYRYDSIYDRGICRALQLNVNSPALSELLHICNVFPHLEIIVQVPLWREDLMSPESLSDFVSQYIDLNISFLFDPSGGRGKGLSTKMMETISMVVAGMPKHIRTVFAGGLSGNNVPEVCAQIFASIGRAFSIDAEGKLRGGKFNGYRIGDRMNPEKVLSFLLEAKKALQRI